jgi:hypothetical protein
MPIQSLHTYLVHSNKNALEPRPIGGAEVPLEGMVFSLLSEVYEKSDYECAIDISFNASPDGMQFNPCRDLLQQYIRNRSIESGRGLAERLGSFTTNRSGLGLLFLIYGLEGNEHKLVVARFPAKSGILAEEAPNELNVAYLERVFMRSATAYKAVVFKGDSIENHFWRGKAVDRQINSRDIETSAYWIVDFLDADLLTTSALGSRRLAIAIKDAARDTADLTVKQELVAVATLANGLANQITTPRQFTEHFGLSAAAKDAILARIPAHLHDENFRLDHGEFKRQVSIKSVKLDNGALLSGDTEQFDELFLRENVGGGEIKFSTVGRIIAEKLEK